MTFTRRDLLAGIPSGLLLAGFLGEVRAQDIKTTAPARILFNENPLGPSPKALTAINSADVDLARYPLGQAPKLIRKLKRRFGLPVASEDGSSLSLKTLSQRPALTTLCWELVPPKYFVRQRGRFAQTMTQTGP